MGLSRDLLIRALAYDLQARAHGGASAALRRLWQSLAETSVKGVLDRGIVLKAGTTLVRQWRGHILSSSTKTGLSTRASAIAR